MTAKNFQELESYPVVLINHKGKQYKLAEAKILANSTEMIYRLVEPKLENDTKKIYYAVLESIKKINIKNRLKNKTTNESIEIISKIVESISKRMNLNVSEFERFEISYFVYKDFFRFGSLTPLFNDKNIDYIFCKKLGEPILVHHKNPNYGFLTTNIRFDSLFKFKNALENLKFVSKTIKPSPEFLGFFEDKTIEISDITGEFSIANIPKNYLDFKNIVNLGIISNSLATHLKNAVKHKNSVLIVGGNENFRAMILDVFVQMIEKNSKGVVFENSPKIVVPHAEFSRKVLPLYGADRNNIVRTHLMKNPEFVIAREIDELLDIVKNIRNNSQTFISMESSGLDDALERMNNIVHTPSLAYLDLILVLGDQGNGWPFVKEIYKVIEYNPSQRKIKLHPLFLSHSTEEHR